jgi:hypothetical protein
MLELLLFLNMDGFGREWNILSTNDPFHKKKYQILISISFLCFLLKINAFLTD